MAFGKPLKYVRIDPISSEEYDLALGQTNEEYESRSHNICWYGGG
jgi:hypothetical protein